MVRRPSGPRGEGSESGGSIFLLVLRFASKRSRSALWIQCVLCGSVCICDMCDYAPVVSLKYEIHRFLIPLKEAANRFIEIPRFMSKYVNIAKENRNLRLQLDILRIKMINTSSMEQELADLKKAVDLRYSVSKYRSIEKVLGLDGAFRRSFLIISATHDESKPGSVVISSEGLVGIIHDMKQTTARVMLITDNKIFIPVISESGERMIMSGNGDASLRSVEICMESSSADIKLAPGDLLTTSGEGGVFPVGIPVAKVTKIDSQERIVYAAPISDLSKSSFVWTMNPVSETE
jgi:rod shape-determining protein MreC